MMSHSVRSAAIRYGVTDKLTQRFTGKERDAETGLDYFGARYFSLAQSRFTAADPLLNSGRPSNPQSWNRYAYALNNPLRFIDPNGLYDWDASLGGSATDDELRSKDGKDKAARRRDNAILSRRRKIENAINKAARSRDPLLAAAGAAYGTVGDHNGVTIAQGPVTPGAAAQTETSAPLTIGAQGSIQANVVVPSNLTGAQLFIALAHEGSHLEDAQSVGASIAFREAGASSFTRYQTEMNAYLVTGAAARALGLPATGASVGGTRFDFWNPSWTNVDRQTRPQVNIDRFLHTSPLYAPTVNDVVYKGQQ